MDFGLERMQIAVFFSLMLLYGLLFHDVWSYTCFPSFALGVDRLYDRLPIIFLDLQV